MPCRCRAFDRSSRQCSAAVQHVRGRRDSQVGRRTPSATHAAGLAELPSRDRCEQPLDATTDSLTHALSRPPTLPPTTVTHSYQSAIPQLTKYCTAKQYAPVPPMAIRWGQPPRECFFITVSTTSGDNTAIIPLVYTSAHVVSYLCSNITAAVKNTIFELRAWVRQMDRLQHCIMLPTSGQRA